MTGRATATAPDPHPAIVTTATTMPAAIRSSFFMNVRRSALPSRLHREGNVPASPRQPYLR
jgi:hypothetical protein